MPRSVPCRNSCDRGECSAPEREQGIIRARILMVVFLFGFFGCKEEVVVYGPDMLADPRVSPKVVFTYPPMNSTGPYETWGTYPYPSYVILVRFNKLMDPVAAGRSFRFRSTNRPAGLRLSGDYYSTVKEDFTLTPSDSGSWSLTPPRIGEVFTLSASEPIVDVNGNVFPAVVLGEFQPEPFFRIMGTTPAAGEPLNYRVGWLLLRFNSKVDTSICRYITTDPPARSSWSFSYDSTQLTLYVGSMALAASYTLTVGAGAHDQWGNALSSPFSASFPSESFRRIYAEYQTDTLDVELYRSFGVNFSLPIDASTLAGAFHITPDIEDALRLSASSSFLAMEPQADYAPRTRYVVRIDTTLRSLNGLRLDTPASFSFTTGGFRVLGTSPRAYETGVGTSVDIHVSFSGRLDTSTVRRAFSISPPTEGMLVSRVGYIGITFLLADTLRSSMEYAVKVDTSIRSEGGAQMDVPYTFRFMTRGR